MTVNQLSRTNTFLRRRPKQKPNVGQYRSRNSLSSSQNHITRPLALRIEKSIFVPQRPMIEKSFLRSFHSDVLKAVKSNDQPIERPVKRYKTQPLITNNLSLFNSPHELNPAVVYEVYAEKVTTCRLGEIVGPKLVLSSEWDITTNSYKRDALIWSLFYNEDRLCLINDHIIKDISFPHARPLTLILGLKYDVTIQIPGKGFYKTTEIVFKFSDNIFSHFKNFVISYYHANEATQTDFPISPDSSEFKGFLKVSSHVSPKNFRHQPTTSTDQSSIKAIPFSQRLSLPNKKVFTKPKSDSTLPNNLNNIYLRKSSSTDLNNKFHQKSQKKTTDVSQGLGFSKESETSHFNLSSLGKTLETTKPVISTFNSSFSFVFKDLKTLDITPDDFRKLDSGNFLNDTLINFFLKYFHQVTAYPNPKLADSIYFFNSFFYSKLLGGYSQVKKWTSKVDLFKYPYVFVPINHKMHWHLVIVYNLPVLLRDPVHKLSSDEAFSDKLRAHSKTDDCVLFLLNSTGGSTEDNQEVVNNFKDYIVEEGKDKLNMKIDRKRIVMKAVHVPQQNNYCDCGVFLIHYVHMFMSNSEKALNLMFSPLNIEGHLYNTVWKPHAMAAKRENLKRRLVNFQIENKKYQAGLPAATLYDEGDVEAHEVKILGPTARKPSVTEITHISAEETKEDGFSGAIKKLDETIAGSDDDLVNTGEISRSMITPTTPINIRKRKVVDESEDHTEDEINSQDQSRAASVELVVSVMNDDSADNNNRISLKRSARSNTSAIASTDSTFADDVDTADADISEVVIVGNSDDKS